VPSAYIFDFGGTLAWERDPDGLRAARADLVQRACAGLADPATVAAGWRAALADMAAAEHTGTQVSAAWAARRVVGKLAPSAVDALAPGIGAALVDPPEHPQSLALVPGVAGMLARLRRRRIPCAILSNTGLSSGAHNRAWLHTAGIAEAFVADALLFSDELGIGKPAREAFEACLERLGPDGADAAEVVHVGDSEWFDVRGAQRCGLRAILCTPVRADGDGSEVVGARYRRVRHVVDRG
jgi:FMN phosphatase YigB (HAD superfamily)